MTAVHSSTFGRLLGAIGIAFVWIACLQVPAAAQNRNVPKNAVDTIHLKDKRQIRGIALGVDDDRQARIAVSSDWLSKLDKNLFAKTVEQSNLVATRARVQLRDRLQQWEPTGKFPGLDFFVAQELARIEREIEAPDLAPPQFLLLKIKLSSIANIQSASEANRNIALWSWYEQLSNVENRSVSQLSEELATKKIDWKLPAPDLSTRFLPTEEDDDCWACRFALVSYRLANPVEYQGSGDTMIQVEANAPIPIAALVPQILQSQMNSLVRQLTEGQLTENGLDSKKSSILERDWVKVAIGKAEAKGYTYFRATQLRRGSEGPSVFVDSIFLARLPSGKWSLVWTKSSDASAASASLENKKRIREDPQIKSLQAPLEILGGAEAFDQAIQMGAATMAAQNEVNNDFNRFLERYLQRWNSPMLPNQTP